MLNDEEKKLIFKLARSSICRDNFDLEKLPNFLKEKKGVFVTLIKNNKLRGCVGYTEPVAPLHLLIKESAFSAAYRDFRFPPLQDDELGEIKIEISILSKPEPVKYKSKEDLLYQLNHGLGVVITKGNHRATFLPQVWQELPRKEEFLAHLCLKAGLAADEWMKGDINVLFYNVEIYTE